MKKWLQNFLGITELVAEKKRTNLLLEQILKESKKTADLTYAYNKQVGIRG